MLVTATVRQQVAGLFIVKEKGPHELKGVPGAPTLYWIVRASGGRRAGARVYTASGGRRAGARVYTPLIGREDDLGVLLKRWERARAGEGQFIQIVGEPGLGKSRLVEEFRNRLAETPHSWVEWDGLAIVQNTAPAAGVCVHETANKTAARAY